MIIKEHFDLTNCNSYRVRARCRTAIFPETKEELQSLFTKKTDYIIMGRGNNLILSKKFYENDFIILSDNFSKIEVSGQKVQALSGTNMFDLAIQAQMKSLSGFEYFYDIPSSLGGAVVMNAGSNGIEIDDFIVSAEVLDIGKGSFSTYTKDELNLSYRNSIFQERGDLIVVSALFELKKGNKEVISTRMREIKSIRDSKQPKDYPSAGSVFKRPKGAYVGPMLEALGLKGMRIGGAKISEKHAGFIVNEGNATGEDIVSLIEFIQDRVRSEFGISLEVEQKII